MLHNTSTLWSAENDDQLHCIQVRNETADVKTFVFKGVGTDGAARHFAYLAGQFGTFEFIINGQSVNRCYTWSSSPSRPDTISITVKRVPNGVVSNWLHEHLKVGDVLNALGPSGEFSCFVRPIVPKYLFISGGSGITPLMSMARMLHDSASTADVLFVHCARTPADVIFAQELALLAHNMPNFRPVFLVDEIAGQNWNGLVGRMSANALLAIAPDFAQRATYTCGPGPFMGAVKQMLHDAGYNMAQYFEESFSFENLPQNDVVEASNPDATGFSIQLAKQNKALAGSAQHTILSTALDAGVRWPHSCANGVCGTCKTKKISGEVQMNHNGGIRPREIREGWILPCCSTPLSDLVLDA
ncbi:MAG: FAD-binding oxidoreductase [Formosimonas sp.]